jgi:hypothetical protein
MQTAGIGNLLIRRIFLAAGGPWWNTMSTTSPAIEDAEKAGFDLSLMDASLSYSYEKRAIQHQEALNLALELERVGRQLRDRSQSSSTAPLRR